MDGLADAAVNGLAAQDAAIHVDDLQGSLTFIIDNPVAVAIERKGP